MTQDKVTNLMLLIKDKVPSDKIVTLKNALEGADDSLFETLTVYCKLYNPIITLVLSVTLGAFGVDRFYIGDVGVGVCKLLFGWLTFGIWPLVDIFFSFKRTKEKNLKTILDCIQNSNSSNNNYINVN